MEEARQVKVYVDVNQVMMYLRIAGSKIYSGRDLIYFQNRALQEMTIEVKKDDWRSFDLAYDLTGMIEKFGGIE